MPFVNPSNRRLFFFISLIFIGVSTASTYWYYLSKDTSRINHNDFITERDGFTYSKEEAEAIAQWLNTSGDEIAKGVSKQDPAALWIQGQFLLIGAGGWTIDTKTANYFFSKSASLGFAPALKELFVMYNSDYRNPFLGLVYLNLTISSGHIEFVKAYDALRATLVESNGLLLADEIEKVAIHKKNLIFKNKELINKNHNGYERCHTSIADEDVLFDMNHWQGILDGSVNTGNLEAWLSRSDNFSLKIDRLAAEATKTIDRLNSYDLS